MPLQSLVVICAQRTKIDKLNSWGKFCAKQIRRSRKQYVQTLQPKSTHSSSIKILKGIKPFRYSCSKIMKLESILFLRKIKDHNVFESCPHHHHHHLLLLLLLHTYLTLSMWWLIPAINLVFFFFFFLSSAFILILLCLFSYLLFSLPRLLSLS